MIVGLPMLATLEREIDKAGQALLEKLHDEWASSICWRRSRSCDRNAPNKRGYDEVGSSWGPSTQYSARSRRLWSRRQKQIDAGRFHKVWHEVKL